MGAELDAEDGLNFEDHLVDVTEQAPSVMETSKSLDQKIRKQLMELIANDR